MRRSALMAAIWISVFCVVSMGASLPAQARQQSAENGTLMSAAARVLEDGTKVPSFTEVITADAIAASTARNVPEVLRVLAGFHIADITGAGRYYRVDMRGFGDNSQPNILMLIDGRPANLSDPLGPDWSVIPLERIARIEIVAGGRGNVIYGDHAAAGVINIVTRTGGPLGGYTAFEYGSFDTKKTTAAVGQAIKSFSYEIATGYVESEGFRDNGDRLVKDIGGGMQFSGQQNWRLFLSAGYQEDDTGSPGALPADNLNAGGNRRATLSPQDSIQSDDFQTQAGLELTILSNDLFKLDASYRDRSLRFYQGADPQAAGGGWSDTNIDTDSYSIAPQLVFQEDFDGIANRMILGYDLIQVRQKLSTQEAAARYMGDDERLNSGFYAHDELKVGGRWGLSGGYRLERVTYEFRRAPVNEKILDEETWNAALAYYFGDNARIYGSYTQGARFPVFYEVLNYRTAIVDSALQAQTFDNYEIGLHTRIAGRLNLGINLFQITTEDEIFENPADQTFTNLDWDTVRQGLELILDLEWKGLRLGGGYTYTEAEVKAGPFKNSELPDVPSDRAFATIGYQFSGGFFMGLEGFYVGARHLAGDWANTAAKLEDYLVINAKLGYTWRWLTFYADFNNIFNEAYATNGVLSDAGIAGYYPAPDFNFLAGVRFGFGGAK